MAKQSLNLGSTANDGTGDPLRTAGDKSNDNFDELYNLTQSAVGSVRFAAASFSPVLYTGSESITSNALVFSNKATAQSLTMLNGSADGEIKIFVNINAGTLTVNATSSNISTPAGGTSFTIQARGSAIIVWSATAAKWFMVSTDLSNTTVTST